MGCGTLPDFQHAVSLLEAGPWLITCIGEDGEISDEL